MKVYISLDMEGMAGIVDPSQQTQDRELFRDALHAQLGWVVEGIRQSTRNDQVESIVVSDSHHNGTNLVYGTVTAMDDRISLVSGSPRRRFMMAGLDGSFDVCFFVGFHAGSGAGMADMDHTFSSSTVRRILVNGAEMNESTVDAALAGDFRVPVGLVVGDSGLRRQLKDQGMMPWVEYVTTKESLSNHAAVMRPAAAIRADTVAAVGRALEALPGTPLYTVEHPCKLTIEFRRTIMADEVAQVPGTTREDGCTVSIPCKDISELMCGISSLTTLASCML